MIKLTADHNTTAGVTGQAISFFSEIVFGISCYKLTDKWCIAIEKHSYCAQQQITLKRSKILFSVLYLLF